MKTIIKTLIFLSLLSLTQNLWAKERIISAGGSVTEILYELGMGEEIIAVDSSSYYPYEAQQKPQIGYFRRLSAEGVLSLKPTLIIGANGTGPDEAIKQISETGVKVKIFQQEIYTLESWKKYMSSIGTYVNLIPQSQTIIKRVENRLHQLKTKDNSPKKAIFLMGLGERGPIAAGKNTVPDMLFNLSGMINVADEFESFKPISTEQLVTFQPDVIVMPSHVVDKMGGKANICQSVTIQLVSQNKGCNLLVMDALLALGFGTRIDQAVEILSTHEF